MIQAVQGAEQPETAVRHTARTREAMDAVAKQRGRVLAVDDETSVLAVYQRILEREGYDVVPCAESTKAFDVACDDQFDVVLSDISMPGMDGVDLLRSLRQKDNDVPVILVTGLPTVETAAAAVELGAVKYLIKPVERAKLLDAIAYAVRMRQLAKLKREAMVYFRQAESQADRETMQAQFDSALAQLWMAFQPIVDCDSRRVRAYEALVRSREPAMPHPGALFDAAEKLDRVYDLGRAIRANVAAATDQVPEDTLLFVNVHPSDLHDEFLYRPDQPLSKVANRVVLELTERATLSGVKDLARRLRTLRDLGFRIAVDDLGSGYAGLSTFVSIQPEVAKIDMSLVRDVDRDETKVRLIRAMTQVCHDLDIQVVTEGVETLAECNVLRELGCRLLQGFFFARPQPCFPSVDFDALLTG